MKPALAAAAIIIISAFLFQAGKPPPAFANDVSWPNCGPQVRPTSANGIVGINGGRIYTLNPCFDKQAAWFKLMDVYLNTGYPGKSYALKYGDFPSRCSTADEECLAYNYGYNAVKYSAEAISLKPVLPSRWWLDVETANSWSDDVMLNRQAILGMLDGLGRYAGRDVAGIYSAPRQWRIITGGWQNGLPTWVATGSLDQKDALEACENDSFNGGPLLLAQYTRQLDENVFCEPGSFHP